MKILTVNHFFAPFGGGEIIAYNTYKLLKYNGHESYFFATDKKPYFEENYKYVNYFPHYDKSIKTFLFKPIKYYWNIEAKNNLKKFINEIKPDIIHFHSLRWLTCSTLDICQKYNIPTILTLHDASHVCPVSTLLYKNQTFCKNILCNSGNYLPCILNNCASSGLEASIRQALFEYITVQNNVFKNINHFITPSNALKQLIIKANIGINSDKISVINNFLEDSYIAQEINYNNKGYFLYSGRLSKEKGLQYLLDAILKLPKDINFHIVGIGPEEKKIAEFIEKNNLYNVKLLGFMNREKLLTEYRNCIAGIHPCNWFENFPTSIMEFFACGKPVIGSNIGGIPEQIEHNKTGLLFEPANVNKLINNIELLYNNNNLAIQYGYQAAKKAKEHYSKERYYNELIDLYKKLI